ncbi:DUF992 domain-containing protein [Roseomonas indoligenes]|uniref:DUF992 domain-containing protein n=1 Tax=Roseomonas indoligenes TaxID=2820811 RepID=A0A940MZX9_9PROT|nr:DUF992 domain-containing protein [Pararoseomonas indoligenes]MBP0494145.1 DUF992 domain-containing protein [Pararoseomonas indoligenes]
MNRPTFLAAAALLAFGGPALAQSTAQSTAPGTPPGTVAPGTVIPGQGVVLQPGQPIPPGMVQTGTAMTPPPGQQAGNTRVGQLQCDVSGGISFVFGSTKDLSCEFKPVNGAAERYTGEIRRFGVDLGFTGRGTMVWTVVNTGSDIAPGSLAGTYGGASSNVSAGLGLGSNVLIGGSRDQVALQPLSIESSTGINVAAGIAEMTLKAGG